MRPKISSIARAGDVIVPSRIAEFLELIEDHAIWPSAPNFPALVVDFLYVRFAAGRGDDLSPDGGAAIQTARATSPAGRMATAVQPSNARVERPAAAIIAGAGPDGFLVRRIKLPADQPGHEAAERRADLVRSGREMASDEADDPRRHAGQRGRKLNPVALVESAAFFHRLVLPGDAEKIGRIQIVHPDASPAGT